MNVTVNLCVVVFNFVDSLCYQQIQNVKMLAQGGVIALIFVLDEGNTNAYKQGGWTCEFVGSCGFLGEETSQQAPNLDRA